MKINFPFRLPTDISTLTAMSFRNKGHLLQRILSKLFLVGGGKTRPSISRGIYVIVQRLLEIKKHQGLRGLTSYLKTCSVSSQQALGGMVHPNLTDLNTRVSRTSKGIPKILPVPWRNEIFHRPILCKLILSIFAIYRFFLYESPVKIRAITDPYSGTQTILKELSLYIPAFFKALKSINAYEAPSVSDHTILPSFNIYEECEERPDSIFPILTKGPTTSNYNGPIPLKHQLTTGRAVRKGKYPLQPIAFAKSI